MAICLLLRHGRTTANADGILAGWSAGVHLDDVGAGQARAVAEQLGSLPLRRLVTSPLERCTQTASYVAARHPGLVTEECADLGECHYGSWTGRPLKELAEEPLWRLVQDQPSAARFPDSPDHPAESLVQLQARALGAVRRIDAQVEAEHGPTALWVAVSHGDVIKAVLADAVGAHLDHFQRLVVDPASVSVVSYTARRPFVIRMNDTGTGAAQLAALGPGMTPAEGAPGDAAVGGGQGPVR